MKKFCVENALDITIYVVVCAEDGELKITVFGKAPPRKHEEIPPNHAAVYPMNAVATACVSGKTFHYLLQNRTGRTFQLRQDPNCIEDGLVLSIEPLLN